MSWSYGATGIKVEELREKLELARDGAIANMPDDSLEGARVQFGLAIDVAELLADCVAGEGAVNVSINGHAHSPASGDATNMIGVSVSAATVSAAPAPRQHEADVRIGPGAATDGAHEESGEYLEGDKVSQTRTDPQGDTEAARAGVRADVPPSGRAPSNTDTSDEPDPETTDAKTTDADAKPEAQSAPDAPQSGDVVAEQE